MNKSLRVIAAAALLALLSSGCSGRSDTRKDETDSVVTTSADTGTTKSTEENNNIDLSGNNNSENTPQNTGTSGNFGSTVPEDKNENIKEMYIPSAEEAEILKDENTKSPITFSGFKSYYFTTPVKSEVKSIASVTPLYSHAGLHNYLEQNSKLYDFGKGEGSFEAFAERYMDSFFADNGVLVIAFTDSAGGSGYTLTGAWQEHLHIDDLHLEQLVLAIKKQVGENTAGHLIVEMNTDFISLWDSITIELYE